MDSKSDTEWDPSFTSDNPEDLFLKLYARALASGMTQAEIASLKALQDIRVPEKSAICIFFRSTLKCILLLFAVLFIAWFLDWPVEKGKLAQVWLRLHGVKEQRAEAERCLIHPPKLVADVFRPPIDCSFCANVTEVSRLVDVNPEEFEEMFAYSGRPAVIVDAAKNWSALEVFSFEFFQQLYNEDSSALKSVESRCQFFPYKTEFRGLREVFRMTPDRARMKDGAKPWYVGWSNCDVAAGNVLRQHYQRPYFLPRAAESSKTDWLFMGSPGYGAHMHIDDVHLPSWQAQIVGTKRWTLEPPPECLTHCVYRMQVDVRPGEIIVLDTNKWFHSTLNVGQDVSITIGSEFD